MSDHDVNSSTGERGGMRYGMAKAAARAAAWGLMHIAHREAGNMPGKIARYIDPHVIADAAASKLRFGSIAVVGTNGKTTVTNLIADAVEASGYSVICNRSGANLYSGIATALLRAKGTYDWGVFESDELWLAKSLPQLKSRYAILLNLFRDQLDRCGEIDRIQDAIVDALASSPDTVLVYNADDPLCAMVAQRASEVPARKRTPAIAFGVAEDMGLAQNLVSDCTMCQSCSHMLRYDYRQYGQLGSYVCPRCGFKRPSLQVAARDVEFGMGSLSFSVDLAEGSEPAQCSDLSESAASDDAAEQVNPASLDRGRSEARIHANLSGTYMVYNLLAVFAGAHMLGCPADDIQRAISSFDPKNGRLQEYVIGDHPVLLNLAKNPTGFNQNLRIITQRLDAESHAASSLASESHAAPSSVPAESADAPSAAGAPSPLPSVVAFFINDKEADGHDISWIWDIDFEELAGRDDLSVLAGGIRRNDLQVRLKYAGVKASLIENAADALRAADSLGASVPVYIITNYTALAPVHTELDEMVLRSESSTAAFALDPSAASAGDADLAGQAQSAPAIPSAPSTSGISEALSGDADVVEPVVIAHMFPDLLNLYGDGGNVRILERRLAWRGIPVEVRHVTYGETIDLDEADLVFMGGGPDGEQSLAAKELHKMRDQLVRFIDEGAPVLAICGGYQIMGDTWLLGEEEVPGLGMVDASTRRPGSSGDRLIDNIALHCDLASKPVIGYENHASRTYLGDGEKAFGKVISRMGRGNNDETAEDGIIHNNAIGTYLHGPLLSKNPEIADWLLCRALERHAARMRRKGCEGSNGEGDNGACSASPSESTLQGERKGEQRLRDDGKAASCSAYEPAALTPLDDTEELAANDFMAAKII